MIMKNNNFPNNNQDDLKNKQIDRPELEEPEVSNSLSKVATSYKQGIMIFIIVTLVLSYVIFKIIKDSSDVENNDSENKIADIKTKSENIKVVQSNNIDEKLQSTVKVDQTPLEVDTNNTIAPPPNEELKNEDKKGFFASLADTSAITNINKPDDKKDDPTDMLNIPEINLDNGFKTDVEDRRAQVKMKSSIMLVQGSSSGKPQGGPNKPEDFADFTERGNLELLLGKGKMISAILETAINSDFGGEIRAIINKDVYSESGKVILIPKGSRVFGSYQVGISGDYGRINISWFRVDLSTGYSVSLIGSGVDNLGRSGSVGRLDNKVKERLTNTVLASTLDILIANALDKIVAPPLSSTNSRSNMDSANRLYSLALAIFQSNDQPELKIERICTEVANAITDKSSSAYMQFNNNCIMLKTNSSATPEQKLTTLMGYVSGTANNLISDNVTNTEKTKAQASSEKAFNDITNEIRDVLALKKITPNITINQGTIVKIYVTKDYKFPKAALNGSRLIK